MKKQLLLAALVSATFSGWAARPVVNQLEGLDENILQPVPVAETRMAVSSVAPKDVTEATKAVMTMPETLYFLGMDPDGYALKYNFGQTSAFEKLTFKSASTGALSLLWTYPDLWKPMVDGAFDVSNSQAESITYSSPFALVDAPTLKAIGPNYIDEIDPNLDLAYPLQILYGGFSAMLNAEHPYGMTTCSRLRVGRVEDPDSRYYRGHVLGYDPTSLGEDKRPVVNAMWGDYIEGQITKEDPTAVVSDVTYTGFGTWLPAPASPYQISSVWVFAYGIFTGPGTLKLDVMTIDENDQPQDVIATGSFDFTAETDDMMFYFPLSSVDEFGFEVDEPIDIDSRIAFVIRNLNEEPNIKTFMPMIPAGYTYSASDEGNPYWGTYKSLNLLTYEVDGETVERALPAPWSYYENDGKNLMAPVCYLFFCDAAFGFCVEEGQKVEEPVITKPIGLTGGEVTVTFESLFEMDETCVSSECDWLSYELGDYDSKTGAQSLTVLVDPSDAGRTGSIMVSAPLARPVELRIAQVEAGIEGVGADVNVVASKYFDLQGRELKAQPESGISIRKDIKADGTSTSVKVIR